MNISAFLNCLQVTGMDTGISVLGAYSFLSGDNSIIYNQLHSTGNNYYNGIPYRNALPLIFNGSGNQPSGLFSGDAFYQIADLFESDFSTLIQLNYSGCQYFGSQNLLLATTTQNPASSSSSVVLGITPSNRLFAKVNDYSSTISREIEIGDFAYLNVSDNRFLNFGLFSISDNAFYGKRFDSEGASINVSDLCFGGALNYPTLFSAYSGRLNKIYLFSGALDTGILNNCVDCSFATGYTQTSIPNIFTESKITGSYWSGILSYQQTGTQKTLAQYPRQTGGSGYVYFDSGVSGNVAVYQSLIPMTEEISNTEYLSGMAFSYSNERMSGVLSDLFFDCGLVSGDLVEVYSYPRFKPNLSNLVNGFIYPQNAANLQLFGNGLAETLNVDYTVAFNSLIRGFDSSDILMYDVNTGEPFTVPYESGYITTGDSGSATLLDILSLSGFVLPYAATSSVPELYYDIFLNGQKLTSGVNYSTPIVYSSLESLYRRHIFLSGNDVMDFNNEDYTLEFKLVPVDSSAIKRVDFITTDQSYVSGVSGFSEQVWVNGLRYQKGVDYFKSPRCRFCTGEYNPPNYTFSYYNSLNDSLNLFVPYFSPVNPDLSFYLYDENGDALLDELGQILYQES